MPCAWSQSWTKTPIARSLPVRLGTFTRSHASCVISSSSICLSSWSIARLLFVGRHDGDDAHFHRRAQIELGDADARARRRVLRQHLAANPLVDRPLRL